MRVVLAIACVSAALVVAAARADTASEARFFDDLARREYAAGRFDRALDAFLSVHALAPSSSATYNVALCAELARRPELAFAFLSRYAGAPDDDATRKLDAERRLSALRAQLALIEVVTQPEGARIAVDREELGSHGEAPRTVVVDAGERVVIATLAGHHPARATVRAAVGAVAKAELTLEPILGELELSTVPAHATLHVEREGLPVALPAERPRVRVPVGRYTLRLDAPGHLAAETSVVVAAHDTARVTLIAPPIPPKTGQLLIDTGDTVARLFVDGKAVALTPATLTDVLEGSHALRLVAAGKAPWSATVQVKRDAPTYVNVTLVDRRARR